VKLRARKHARHTRSPRRRSLFSPEVLSRMARLLERNTLIKSPRMSDKEILDWLNSGARSLLLQPLPNRLMFESTAMFGNPSWLRRPPAILNLKGV
jgi:hypothetical protein